MSQADSSLPPQRSLSESLAFGAAWMIGARFAFRVIGLVSTVVLARLLLPEDFGLVALAMIVIGLLDLFSEFGFDLALIQNQRATRDHYDTVWTLSLLRGALTAGVLILGAPWLAGFFHEPRLEEVVYVLALVPLITQSKNPGTADFRKHLNFRREFVFMVAPKFLRFLVTLAIAVVWQSYWALVAGILSYRALQLGASYLMHSFRPRLSLKAWRDVIGFSQWLFVTTTMDAIRQKSSAMILGRVAGAGMLGIFTVAQEIANLATSELVAPIRRALFPGYAKIQDDRAQLRDSFVGGCGLLIVVAMPIVIGIGLTAEHLVPVLLGDKWLAAIPFVQVLTLAGLIASCRGLARPLYMAINRPEVGAYLSILEAALFVGLILTGYLWFGPIGIAWAAAVSEAVMLVLDVWMLRRLLGVRARDWLMRVWRPTAAAATMSACVYALDRHLGDARGLLAHLGVLAACAAVGAIVYGVGLFALWTISGRPAAAPERMLATFAAGKLAGRLRRRQPAPAE